MKIFSFCSIWKLTAVKYENGASCKQVGGKGGKEEEEENKAKGEILLTLGEWRWKIIWEFFIAFLKLFYNSEILSR